jgi:hypothetical protein
VALANQLRSQLETFWAGAVRISADVDSQIALCFIERYPTPEAARTLGPKRLVPFLARHGYCGWRSPEQLLARLRSAPLAPTGEAETEARRQVVLALVAALRPLVERISLITAEIAHAVRQHPDGAIFLSLFRDRKSVVTAARLLGRDRRLPRPRPDPRGVRDSFATPADSTRHWHPSARRHYLDASARGHDHHRAARTVGRAWCRVMWHMWQDRTPTTPPATTPSNATSPSGVDTGCLMRSPAPERG